MDHRRLNRRLATLDDDDFMKVIDSCVKFLKK